MNAPIRRLVAAAAPAHKRLVTQPLFDHRLRALRRDRAARRGVETFLYDRAFNDCLERLGDVRRRFESALLAGCPSSAWPEALVPFAQSIEVIDPGPQFAARAGGKCVDLESLPFSAGDFDLCLTIGLLDTANELALAAAALRLVLRPNGLLIGAVAGGESLPRLRSAMLAADQASGRVAPRVHPRIEAVSLAQLLTSAGFQMPVVDVDRVRLGYRSLDALIADLRAMGATNILNARAQTPVTRTAFAKAREDFLGGGGKGEETIEILHFAAWTPAQ